MKRKSLADIGKKLNALIKVRSRSMNKDVPAENNPHVVYADIIDLPYVKSEKHPHMSLYDRAAQFAPFSALSGYEEMIEDTYRKDLKMKIEGEKSTDSDLDPC